MRQARQLGVSALFSRLRRANPAATRRGPQGGGGGPGGGTRPGSWSWRGRAGLGGGRPSGTAQPGGNLRPKPQGRAATSAVEKAKGRLPACPADAEHAPTGSAGAWRVGETKACDQVPRGGRGFEGAGGPSGGAGLGRARGRLGPGGGGGGGAPDGRAATAASSAVLAGAALGRPEGRPGWQGRMRLPARRSSRACSPRSGSSGHGKSGPRKRRKFSRRRR